MAHLLAGVVLDSMQECNYHKAGMQIKLVRQASFTTGSEQTQFSTPKNPLSYYSFAS